MESTALPSIDQNIMDLSSHPNSLIRMQACRSHHPLRPWTTYLRRNERAMAFPGVDSVIGSNSGTGMITCCPKALDPAWKDDARVS